MAEQVPVDQAISELTESEWKVILGALDLQDQLAEPIEGMTAEMIDEKTPQAESQTATEPDAELDIDEILDCLTEAYEEYCGGSTDQHRNISNESQNTQLTNAASQHTEAASVSTYTGTTITQQQHLLPQIPSHWPTLDSKPNNAEDANFVPPQIYKCNYCRKQCLSRAAYNRHINNYHAKRHLRCWQCGYFPFSGEHLLRHDFYYHSHTRRYYYNVPTF